jgi:hypothetical protein
LIIGADALDPKTISDTLNVLLKFESDIARTRDQLADVALAASKA